MRYFYKTGLAAAAVIAVSFISDAAVAQGVDGLHKLPPVAVTQETLTQKPNDSFILIPCDDQTGIAAFWSGDNFIIVADRIGLSLDGIRKISGPFTDQSIVTLDHATLIRFHLPSHPELSIRRDSRGWQLVVGHASSKSGLMPVVRPGALEFPLAQPGHVVSFPDPATGARLLMMTSRAASGGVTVPFSGPGYRVRASLEGVVVIADADCLIFSLSHAGGVLSSAQSTRLPVGGALVFHANNTAQNQDLIFQGLQNTTPQNLKNRQKEAADKAGQSSGQEKPSLLFDAVRAALAAGDLPAAQELLSQAQKSGAEAVINSPQNLALSGVVALLSGKVKDAEILADTRWIGMPDMTLWRAFYGLQAGKKSWETLPDLADNISKIKQYPDALRDLILPSVAAAIIRYGTNGEVKQLGNLPDTPVYALARGLILMREKKGDAARVIFDQMASSSSGGVASVGHVMQIRLRQVLGHAYSDEIVQDYISLQKDEDEAGIAPASSRQILYLGLSSALMQLRQYRSAMMMLSFLLPGPEIPQDILEQAYRELIRKMIFEKLDLIKHTTKLTSAQKNQISDTVALSGQNLPFLTDGPEKAEILMGYGQLLMALDNVSRAQHIFSQAMVLFPAPEQRSQAKELMARAALLQGMTDEAGQLLESMPAQFLSPALAARKTYDLALLAKKKGKADQALALLAHDETDEGLDLRGQLYEASYRWPDAVLVIGRLATRKLPQSGALTDAQQSLAARLTADAVSAHDTDTLQRLKNFLSGRTMGHEADLLLERQFKGAMIRPPSH
ncbi:lipopolysaccharide assembly protein LapB [Acetobacter sp. DsW_059]|uniref:tetratricopeptide repeat protein n=1 Tax=Acetobacter sp. DsW_059 TaxID=1670661 RepID=UPI000A383EC4|nr:hypothetical protein [Acetobacter sp. DsW_059]OUJ09599.1 hypothetical protein HK25_11370 [Acetobacter sp. DsW_059]